MPAKKMRTQIKVQDGEGEVEADKGHEEAEDAVRDQRRRQNEDYIYVSWNSVRVPFF